MNSKNNKIVFIVFAVFSFVTVLYHIAGAVKPFDTTPVWRHLLFIGINSICIYGLLKRPGWFIWLFGLLTIQQLYSHGTHFISSLHQNRFDWIDAAICASMPLILFLLWIKRKTRP